MMKFCLSSHLFTLILDSSNEEDEPSQSANIDTYDETSRSTNSRPEERTESRDDGMSAPRMIGLRPSQLKDVSPLRSAPAVSAAAPHFTSSNGAGPSSTATRGQFTLSPTTSKLQVQAGPSAGTSGLMPTSSLPVSYTKGATRPSAHVFGESGNLQQMKRLLNHSQAELGISPPKRTKMSLFTSPTIDSEKYTMLHVKAECSAATLSNSQDPTVTFIKADPPALAVTLIKAQHQAPTLIKAEPSAATLVKAEPSAATSNQDQDVTHQ